MGGEKQLWLSVLLKDTSVTAGIRTHILLLTPELESGKLDRSVLEGIYYGRWSWEDIPPIFIEEVTVMALPPPPE